MKKAGVIILLAVLGSAGGVLLTAILAAVSFYILGSCGLLVWLIIFPILALTATAPIAKLCEGLCGKSHISPWVFRACTCAVPIAFAIAERVRFCITDHPSSFIMNGLAKEIDNLTSLSLLAASIGLLIGQIVISRLLRYIKD